MSTDKEKKQSASDERVKRSAKRLRELKASGVELTEILGGRAGVAFIQDHCEGDPDLAEDAFALVYGLRSRS